MKKPLIFITNDDGVNAKGLRSLIGVARRFGRVVVIAPDSARSGMSHAITLNNPLYMNVIEDSEDVRILSCSGTPVDCVKMAFDYYFLDERPDLNISGINHGSNSATNVLYSGTMGAAREASLYGAPTLGLSLDDHDPDADFDGALMVAEKLIADLLNSPVSEQLCLNVNIPACRPEQIKGYKVCRQTKGYWREDFFARKTPMGKDYFWLTGGFINIEPDEAEVDENALAAGYVAVVPVTVDTTNYSQLDMVAEMINDEPALSAENRVSDIAAGLPD